MIDSAPKQSIVRSATPEDGGCRVTFEICEHATTTAQIGRIGFRCMLNLGVVQGTMIGLQLDVNALRLIALRAHDLCGKYVALCIHLPIVGKAGALAEMRSRRTTIMQPFSRGGRGQAPAKWCRLPWD